MKLVDVNLLLYAVDASAPRHDKARAWLEEALSGSEALAFPWAVLLGFVRVATNPAAFDSPLSAEEALAYASGWLDQPVAITLAPSERHLAILGELLGPLGAAGNLTSDAHLAALAIEHGAELYSSDNDFARFAALRWVDPLS